MTRTVIIHGLNSSKQSIIPWNIEVSSGSWAFILVNGISLFLSFKKNLVTNMFLVVLRPSNI